MTWGEKGKRRKGEKGEMTWGEKGKRRKGEKVKDSFKLAFRDYLK